VNIAANNRSQTVTARKDSRSGSRQAIARKAKERKEGQQKEGERHTNRRLFKKGKDPNVIVTSDLTSSSLYFYISEELRRVKVLKTFLIRRNIKLFP